MGLSKKRTKLPADPRIAEVQSFRRAGFIGSDEAHERILKIVDGWIAQLREIRNLPSRPVRHA